MMHWSVEPIQEDGVATWSESFAFSWVIRFMHRAREKFATNRLSLQHPLKTSTFKYYCILFVINS